MWCVHPTEAVLRLFSLSSQPPTLYVFAASTTSLSPLKSQSRKDSWCLFELPTPRCLAQLLARYVVMSVWESANTMLDTWGSLCRVSGGSAPRTVSAVGCSSTSAKVSESTTMSL